MGTTSDSFKAIDKPTSELIHQDHNLALCPPPPKLFDSYLNNGAMALTFSGNLSMQYINVKYMVEKSFQKYYSKSSQVIFLTHMCQNFKEI